MLHVLGVPGKGGSAIITRADSGHPAIFDLAHAKGPDESNSQLFAVSPDPRPKRPRKTRSSRHRHVAQVPSKAFYDFYEMQSLTDYDDGGDDQAGANCGADGTGHDHGTHHDKA